MQLVSCHDGTLRTLAVRDPAVALSAARGRSFRTGLTAIDAPAPGGVFVRGAVHEVLSEPGQPKPRSFALLLARAAMGPRLMGASSGAPAASGSSGVVVWSDPGGEIYPPALAMGGVPMDRLFLLRPANEADEVWAVAECLRLRGVCATVAAPRRLSRVQARRLQLAAEHGGGVGLLLRTNDRYAAQYAAATRWLVQPAPGDAGAQRWSVQLIHGHGGHTHKPVTLEVCRDVRPDPDRPDALDHVRAFDPMADRPPAPAIVARSA